VGLQGRLEALKLLGQFFQRAVGHLLAHHFACGCDAKHNLSALPIGQRAQTAAGAVFLCRGLFEFQRQGFACGDEGLEGRELHGMEVAGVDFDDAPSTPTPDQQGVAHANFVARQAVDARVVLVTRT